MLTTEVREILQRCRQSCAYKNRRVLLSSRTKLALKCNEKTDEMPSAVLAPDTIARTCGRRGY
eukprot:4459017-Pleurochrysis_carterae.AAC.1